MNQNKVLKTQMELKLKTPRQVEVDNMVDKNGIRYIGKATEQFDGTWTCLADVRDHLCIVEVKIDAPPVVK